MAFSLKADDYMVKPFSPRDLVSRVNAAMRRRSEMFAPHQRMNATSRCVACHAAHRGGSPLLDVILVALVVILLVVRGRSVHVRPARRPVRDRAARRRRSSRVRPAPERQGITLRDEVDELAQFLAAWQRVTVDRLSGRVEQSEVLDKGLLAHVAKLLGAERIVVSLVDPSGLRVVDGHPGSRGGGRRRATRPVERAVLTGQIFIGDLQKQPLGSGHHRLGVSSRRSGP